MLVSNEQQILDGLRNVVMFVASITLYSKHMKKTFIPLLAFISIITTTSMAQNKPLKVGVIGLTHTHVHWILGRPADDKVVISRYCGKQYGVGKTIYTTTWPIHGFSIRVHGRADSKSKTGCGYSIRLYL
jgi:hypothetical protein